MSKSRKILTLCLGIVFILSIIALLFSLTAYAEEKITTSVFLDDNKPYVNIETPVSVTENTNSNDENYKYIYVADKTQNKIFVLRKDLVFFKEISIKNSPEKIAFYSDSLYILCSDKKLYTLKLATEEFNLATFKANETDINSDIVDFCIMDSTLAIAKKQNIYKFDLSNNELKGDIITETTGSILSVSLENNASDLDSPINIYYLYEEIGGERLIKLNNANNITNIIVSPTTLNISFKQNNLYLIDTGYVYVWEKKTDSTATFLPKTGAGIDFIKLDEILGINSLDALYIADDYYFILNISTHAVIKCDKSFAYINSYSSGFEGVGKFNKPKQIIEKDGNIYVLDNKRIQIINDNEIKVINLNSFNTTTPINTNNVKSFTVTKDNKIYIIENETIHILDNENIIATINKKKATLTDIATTLDNKVFLLDKNEISLIQNNEITSFLSISNAKKIASNLKDKMLYVLTDTSIEAYSTENKQKLFGTSHNLTNIIDFEIDFAGNMYILSKSNEEFIITKIDAESKNVTYTKALENAMITTLNSLAINNSNGELMFTDYDSHKVFLASKEQTSVTTMNDIPNLALPFDVTNTSYNTSVQVGIVKAFPSTLFYPPHSDANCNIDYINGEIITLDENKEVLILGEQKNFYYVLIDGNVGFIYKNEVELKPQDEFEWFNAKIRDTNTAIYTLPSSKAIDHENAFQIAENSERISLDADTDIRVLSDVCGYTDSNGISYYLISVNGKNAYINANSIYKKTTSQSDNFKMARVSTGINSGETPIYSVMDITTTPIGMLKDNDMVKVYFIEDGFAYISVTDEEGKTLNGYVKNELLVYNGLSTSQIIVISVIGGIVLLFILSLILIKVLGKRKKV